MESPLIPFNFAASPGSKMSLALFANYLAHFSGCAVRVWFCIFHALIFDVYASQTVSGESMALRCLVVVTMT